MSRNSVAIQGGFSRGPTLLPAEPEGRLAAIVDFMFNLGTGRLLTSTLRRRINQRDWVLAALEFRRWVYGGGRELQDLFRDVIQRPC